MLTRSVVCLVICSGLVWSAALDESENDLEALVLRANKLLDKFTTNEAKVSDSNTDLKSLIDRVDEPLDTSEANEVKTENVDSAIEEKALSESSNLHSKSFINNANKPLDTSEAKEVEADNSDLDFKALVERANRLLGQSNTNEAESVKEEKNVKKNVVKLASLEHEVELRDALETFIQHEEEQEAMEKVHKLREALEDFETLLERTRQKKRFCLWCGFSGKPKPTMPPSDCTNGGCEADAAQEEHQVQQ